jgi:hypothetical protein
MRQTMRHVREVFLPFVMIGDGVDLTRHGTCCFRAHSQTRLLVSEGRSTAEPSHQATFPLCLLSSLPDFEKGYCRKRYWLVTNRMQDST